MPKRTDLKKILLIGSGPIIIGQACEFDYSGTQACKALREEGFSVVLVNSNPATIMTDPETADRTYIEPINWQVVAKIIEKERPDALLPTLGGQTGLNTAMDLFKHGVLEKYKCEMIGARADVIAKAEDRALFKEAVLKIGLEVPNSGVAKSLSEAYQLLERIGLPCVLRPSFTMGGTGGGIAYNREEFNHLVALGLELSPVGETLIEESVIGWKEFELEVMRDSADNVVIVCSIENLDPMGVHTGDSITVAPIQTLSDKEYQRMRDAAKAIIREIGVETGGSNIQFAVNPADGTDDSHRNESARLAFVGSRFKSNGLSHRKNRRKVSGRLHARRALTTSPVPNMQVLRGRKNRPTTRQRRCVSIGLLRTDDRLRGDEVSAFQFRKVPGGRHDADDADEIGRRDNGHRTHLQRVAAKSAARPGSRPFRAWLRPPRPLGHGG